MPIASDRSLFDVVRDDLRKIHEHELVQAERWRRDRHAYERHTAVYEACAVCFPPPMTRGERAYWAVRAWWRRWKPVVHFGDCGDREW